MTKENEKIVINNTPLCTCGHNVLIHNHKGKYLYPQLPLGSCLYGANTDYPCVCRNYVVDWSNFKNV